MIDHFSIITQGGIVLWSKEFTASASPIDLLIRTSIIESRSDSISDSSSISRVDKDSYSIYWGLANDFELIFIITFQRILSLNYIEDLLQEIKTVFLADFGDRARLVVDRFNGKALESYTPAEREILANGWNNLLNGWSETFTRILKSYEDSDVKVSYHSTSIRVSQN